MADLAADLVPGPPALVGAGGRPVPATIAAMWARRSCSRLVAPGPSDDELALLLRAATTVPDHNSLMPYRFVVVGAAGQAAFGDALAAALLEARPDAPDDKVAKARSKAGLAPVQVVIVASPVESSVPEWEQVASASCTGFAIALAADALGYAAVWKTAGVLEGTALTELFGLTGGERLLGWVNVGSRPSDAGPLAERKPVDLAALASVLDGDGRRPLTG